jgi:hypothetical protein
MKYNMLKTSALFLALGVGALGLCGSTMAAPTVDLSSWNGLTIPSRGISYKLLDPQHIGPLTIRVIASTSEYQQISGGRRRAWMPVTQAMKIIENPSLPLGTLQLDDLGNQPPISYTWGDFLNVNNREGIRAGRFVVSATGRLNLNGNLDTVHIHTAFPDAWPEIDPNTPLRDVLNNIALTSSYAEISPPGPTVNFNCPGTITYKPNK